MTGSRLAAAVMATLGATSAIPIPLAQLDFAGFWNVFDIDSGDSPDALLVIAGIGGASCSRTRLDQRIDRVPAVGGEGEHHLAALVRLADRLRGVGLEIVTRQQLKGDLVRPDHRRRGFAAELVVLPASERFEEARRGGEVRDGQIHKDHLHGDVLQ